jgi:hypothetical protein
MSRRVPRAAALLRAAARLPVLTRLPIVKLVALGELALVARKHLQLLQPDERRRLLQLARRGRGMSGPQREELRGLLAKLDARGFAGSTVARLSPVPVPRRLTRARY